MWLVLTALLASAQEPPDPPAAAPRESATTSRAYLDPGVAELIRLARARRDSVDRSLAAYRALAQDRISIGFNTARRDRLLFRCESAARMEWRHDSPIRLEMLGERHTSPIGATEPRVPENPTGCGGFMFDPWDDYLSIGTGGLFDSEGGTLLRHPLAAGSEEDYRFRSGDTTQIRLPDGRTIRIIEVQILPARPDYRLIRGTLSVDADSYAVVRATFRLGRAFDYQRDSEERNWIPPFIAPIRADVNFVSMEFGLWDMRWWLPRLVAYEGYAELGGRVRFPFRYELGYTEYEVEPWVGPEPPPAVAGARIPRDSIRELCRSGEQQVCACRGPRCWRIDLHLPEDRQALLLSEYLPATAYDANPALLTDDELEDIMLRLKDIPTPPWRIGRPELRLGGGHAGLRYNRVEGASMGLRGGLDLGRFGIHGTGRIGAADRKPRGELAVVGTDAERERRVVGYHRLATVDPRGRALGAGNSFNALIFGRDDGDYFAATGVEVAASPALTSTGLAWRVYAERQRPVSKETDFSLRRAFYSDHVFRDNILADSATQYGADLVYRFQRGRNPNRLRWGSAVGLDLAAGDFEFVRPSAALWVTSPLPGRRVASLELAAGTTAGEVPVQSLWYLGGPGTLRGYPGSVASGTAFWRARAELARGRPGARIALFGDVGWAGDRVEVRSRDAFRRPLAGAGIGLSLLDGLIRLDVARALRSPTGWRVDFYLDGLL